jgi:hypothetical protein
MYNIMSLNQIYCQNIEQAIRAGVRAYVNCPPMLRNSDDSINFDAFCARFGLPMDLVSHSGDGRILLGFPPAPQKSVQSLAVQIRNWS